MFSSYTTSREQLLFRIIITCALAAVLVMPFVSSAKEITSGGAGGGTVTPTCTYVQNLTVKGDYRAGETGVSSITGNYTVKPCATGENLTVETSITEWSTGSEVYNNPAGALSDKFAVFGHFYGIYTVRVNVKDADTGALVETKSFSVSLVPRRI